MKLGKFPTELKQRPQWVCWKYVTRDGKQTKMPFMPSGDPASSTDPATWSTFKACVDASGFSGVGFVFMDGDAYIGIDLDGCRDPETSKLEEWAKEVVLKFATYAEVSPSGSGVKLFGIAEARWPHRNNVKLPLPSVGGKDAGVEVYDGKRFFCVTGKQLKDMAQIKPVDEQLDWLATKFDMRHALPTVAADRSLKLESPVLERASRYLAKMPPSVSGQAGHNACFHAACVLVMGFCLDCDEAYRLLANEFNPRCQPPWSEKELRHKVSQASKQPGARGYLRDAQPADWDRIRLPASYKESKQPAEDEPGANEPKLTNLRTAVVSYLSKLASGKEILTHTGIPALDNAIGGGVAFGEMVIIAARPSHGKSAIGLQMAHTMSEGGLPVALISEEMSALALAKRTVQFASETRETDWVAQFDTVADEMDAHFKARADVTIVEACGSVERAVAVIERLAADGKCKVAMIDYAQLLDAKGKDRYERISRVSQTLRMMASRLQIIVLVLAQLNREIENRKPFIPRMSDIKETGQLEQDADVILFGVWPFKIDPSEDPKKYQFYVAKNRNREITRPAFECEFIPARQKLVEQEKPPSQFAGDFQYVGSDDF